MGTVLAQLRRFEEARGALERAITGLLRYVPEDHSAVELARGNLARLPT